jgi:hypothetical protein
MKSFTLKKLAVAALLSAGIAPAFAANYYVVVPVPNRTATAGNILVTLSGFSLPQGLVGDVYAGFDFNTVLQVKGDPNFNASNVHWSVASGALPAGLTLSANGKLSGTPTAASASSFQLLAAYKTKAGQQVYTVTINNLVVGLGAAELPNGVQGAAYSFDLKTKLTVTGDSAYTGSNVTWSVVSGSLPAGLSLDANGVISGTPSAENAGTPFTVRAGYKTRSGQQAYQVLVGAITVSLANATLPAGKQGAPYSIDLKPQLSISGDAAYSGAGVTWSVASGSNLPDGLNLSADGVISGTPTAENSGTPFTIQASYKTKTGQQAYQVVVGAIVVSLASTTLPDGKQGAAYSFDLKSKLAVSGDAAYSGLGVTWTVASGSLPQGLSLSANGVITGTPTDENAGTPFTIQAAYKTKTGQQAYKILVGAIVVTLNSATLPAGVQGAAYSFDFKPSLSITGDAAYSGSGVTWSVASGSLPAGLSLSTDGVISGTPTAENTGTPFTVQASYKTKSGQQSYQVVVGAIVVTMRAVTLPGATNNEAYSFDFKPYVQVTGDATYAGTSAVKWAFVGAAPLGLALDPNTGILSGKPTGSSSGTAFTVQATYKTKTGQYAYTLISAATPVVLAPSSWGPGGSPQAYYYEDQTVAASCKDYRNAKSGYAAATVSGYYWVNMGAGTERVYCDMNTAGGGWTLVARSGGAVVTNATFCNSGASGVNTPFGWTVARGTPADTANPYSMGVFNRNLAFTEVLIGGASGSSNSWGSYVYQQSVSANFKSALTTTDTALATSGFSMSRYMGHTVDTTQYFFRDVPDGTRNAATAYGLHADGWQTCYGDGPTSLSNQGAGAVAGGYINYRHGMLMVR